MTKILSAFLAVSIAGAIPAQSDAPAQDADTAKISYTQLFAKFRTKRQEIFRAYRALSPEEQEGFDFNQTTLEILPEFIAGAKAHAGLDTAIPFLTWIASNTARSNKKAARSAVDTLLTSHVESKDFAPAIRPIAGLARSIGNDKAFDLLTTVITKNKHPQIIAKALYSRGNMFIGYETKGTEEQLKQALADFATVAETSKDPKLQARAKGKIFEYHNLSVGCSAPDIEGKDLDGVSFKLSDYRGKIVFLDFWGNW